MQLAFRPLKNRPPSWRNAATTRPRSPFTATHTQTLDTLDRELHHLGATNAFLQVELSDPSRGVRLDGQIRSGASVIHPGVILTIETRTLGTLVYDTDEFDSGWKVPGWQANLRAITLGLEALRKVERYGIAKRGQQYAGFAELGSGIPMGSGAMSIDEAAELLAREANESWSGGNGECWIDAETLIADRDLVAGAYRDAVKLHHPDAGGDSETFRRLTEARDLLLNGGPA